MLLEGLKWLLPSPLWSGFIVFLLPILRWVSTVQPSLHKGSVGSREGQPVLSAFPYSLSAWGWATLEASGVDFTKVLPVMFHSVACSTGQWSWLIPVVTFWPCLESENPVPGRGREDHCSDGGSCGGNSSCHHCCWHSVILLGVSMANTVSLSSLNPYDKPGR